MTLPVQPKNASLNELFLQDQYLLTLGIPSEITFDNLLGYAYMQRGVEQATIQFSPGSEDGKVNPSVTYTVQLDKQFGKRYASMHAAMAQGGILGRLKALYLSKRGIPLPGRLEKTIEKLAGMYLPPNYKVLVHVE